jgi:dimethylhistidine N-methyltransferase/ergothioneine biosynthesis protein EgtC
MCRHLAYVGEPVSLQSLIIDPPHGLGVQAWAPRLQAHGTVNADGFGVGWYADGDPAPARYRRAAPIWADPSFADLARVTRSRAVLAAVRSATAGTEVSVAAAAPFATGPWLFSHNGALAEWPSRLAGLAAGLPAADLLTLEARSDSALIWVLVQRELAAGYRPGPALERTVAALVAAGVDGRFNLLLTDGETIAATAAGDTLWHRDSPGGVLVASEPDDHDGWAEVPNESVLEASRSGVHIRPLRTVGAPAGVLEMQRLLPNDFIARSLRADVTAGLTAEPKTLPPKWFYDERGSELFEKITQLDEYYPTRAERAILAAAAPRIAAASGADTLIELGAGFADKTRLLLDALRAAGALRRYVPVDVSESALAAGARRVLAEYPGLEVSAMVSDFEEHLGLPGEGRRMVAFLGSTIGNLLPDQRAKFLSGLRAQLRAGDTFLVGTDLVKDPRVLVAAYDDSAGVTAAFNKNILSVVNAELGANFDPDGFDHVAVWDPAAEWIEMRLRSAELQRVTVAELGLTVTFAAGEDLRTEVSAKFRREGIAAELAAAGFELTHWWTDPHEQFGLSLSVPA